MISVIILFPPMFLYDLSMFNVIVHATVLFLYWLWTPYQSLALKSSRLVQKYGFEYFNFQVSDPHHTIENSSTQNTLFIVHPHGVYAVTLFGFFGVNLEMNHVKVAGSSLLFRIPFVKDLMGLFGCISVKKMDLVKALESGSVAMCPGGLRELLLHYNSCDYTCLKRKGFVKVAKEVGNCDIVLVKSPLERTLYSVWTFSWIFFGLQDWCLTNLLYPFPIFSWGNNWFPFWPRKPTDGMSIIFGKPISVNDAKSVDELFEEIYAK